MLLKATFDTRKTNENFREGRTQDVLERVTNALQPEAVDFYPENGKGTGIYIFHMQDWAQLPALTETLFSGDRGSLFVAPVMAGDDFQRGFQQMSG